MSKIVQGREGRGKLEKSHPDGKSQRLARVETAIVGLADY